MRETVEPCPTCGATTPHSYRRLSVAGGVALLLALAGVVCATAGLWIPAVAALLFAAVVWLNDRERCWDIACVRCRGRRLDELGRTRPKLGSTTMIDPF